MSIGDHQAHFYCQRCGGPIASFHVVMVDDPPVPVCMSCLRDLDPKVYEQMKEHQAIQDQFLRPPRN